MKTDITIGLFGTCGNSKWRDEFIAQYTHDGIDFFNPDAGDNWHPGLVVDENKHLREDDIILFPVLGESLGVGSLAEIGFSILNVKRNIDNGSNQHLIVLIDDFCTFIDTATDEEMDMSNRTRKLVKSKLMDVKHQNIIIVKDLDSMLLASLALIEAIDLHDEVLSNFDIRNLA